MHMLFELLCSTHAFRKEGNSRRAKVVKEGKEKNRKVQSTKVSELHGNVKLDSLAQVGSQVPLCNSFRLLANIIVKLECIATRNIASHAKATRRKLFIKENLFFNLDQQAV